MTTECRRIAHVQMDVALVFNTSLGQKAKSDWLNNFLLTIPHPCAPERSRSVEFF